MKSIMLLLFLSGCATTHTNNEIPSFINNNRVDERLQVCLKGCGVTAIECQNEYKESYEKCSHYQEACELSCRNGYDKKEIEYVANHPQKIDETVHKEPEVIKDSNNVVILNNNINVSNSSNVSIINNADNNISTKDNYVDNKIGLERNNGRISIGMLKQEILNILGMPTNTNESMGFMLWYYTNTKWCSSGCDCILWFRDDHLFSFGTSFIPSIKPL